MKYVTYRQFLILAIVVTGLLVIVFSLSNYVVRDALASTQLTPKDWLLSEQDDDERFRRIQAQLRGFDQPMWEVGERYRRMYEALELENYDLAIYHWEKIGTSIRNGIAKRPARAGNAKKFFLDDHFDEVLASLETRMQTSAWTAFARTKKVCMSCHEAENVGYMNMQPLFNLAPP
jgi:hypothetical protein